MQSGAIQMPYPKSICVYCGSSNAVRDEFKNSAFELGRLMGEAKIRLVYGGGRVGLMGRVADGCIVAGGEVTGIIPSFLSEKEVSHPQVTDLIVVETMHERKQLMVDRSDAFVILPGGIGTLDEFFEIVSWRQLRLHDKPIIVVDQLGYWSEMIGVIDKLVAEGFAQQAHRDAVVVVSTIEDALEAAGKAPPPMIDVATKWM